VLSNTGEGEISIGGISATDDFSKTNNCGASLVLGATCNIEVAF
jgi:dihydroorotate dehydrogenase